MSVQDEIPRSRLTLTYKTTVNGQPETVNLPFRMLVLADLSLGSSADRQVDLEERRLRSLDGKNLDALMKDMKMSLKFTVDNKVNPDKEAEIAVELPITGMRSFSPDEIVKHVPKLRALALLKGLLLEMQSNVDNRKDLRKLVQDLFSKPEAFKDVLERLKGYESFQLPAQGTAPAQDSAQ